MSKAIQKSSPIKWGLRSTPYEIQKIAREWGSGKRGAIYELEMGLGKTAIILDEFLELVMKDEVKYLIVVCPTFCRDNWVNEISKQFKPGVCSVHVWPKSDATDVALDVSSQAVVWVLNYESIIHTGGKQLYAFLEKSGHQAMIVADESYCIKNPQAAVTRGMLMIAKLVRYRRCTVGMMMSNNVLDLWSQMRFVGALDGVNQYQFKYHFAVLGGFRGKKITGVKNEEGLKKVLEPYVLTATKADWTDLPEKTYITRSIEMTGAQKSLYDQMLEEFVIEVDGKPVSANMVISQAMKLQQISRGFIIDTDTQETHKLVDDAKNPCILAAKDLSESVSGKLLIFAYYKASVSALLAAFPNAARLTSGMTQDEVIENKRRFNEDSSCKEMVLQITTGARGHTLLGTDDMRCHNTLFYENVYSLELRKQCEDRNHRHGQDRAVNYVDLVSSPEDKKIAAALVGKQNLVDVFRDMIKARNDR